MQSKQEMATIGETEGGGEEGGRGRWMEARRQMESWTLSQRKRGENEFLAVKTEVNIS